MRSHAKIFLFTTLDMWQSKKVWKLIVWILCTLFIFGEVNGYFEKITGNKYLTLVNTSESRGKWKKYEYLWIKIRDLIRAITKNLDDYDEKYMKIKLDSDDNLSLNKTTEIPKMTIVVRAVFHENNKYYPHVILGECLYKL